MIPGIMIYLEDLSLFDETLDDAEIGKVVRALAQYAKTGGGAASLSQVGKIAFKMMRIKLDRDIATYEKRVAGGRQGGRPKEHQETSPNLDEPHQTLPNPKVNVTEEVNVNVTEKGEVTEFVPPTLDQVRKYITERGLTIDPETFWMNYQAKGWMMGAVKMRDWEAACECWQRNDATGKPNLRVLPSSFSGQREMTEEDLRVTSEVQIMDAIMAARREAK